MLTLSIVPSAQRRAARRPVAVEAAEGKRGELGEPAAHKFRLHGATLNPSGSEEKDPLAYRVECLRVFLDAVMGDEFVACYRRIMDARGESGGANDAAGAVSLTKTVQRALIRQHKGLLPLVYQLVYSEEAAFSA